MERKNAIAGLLAALLLSSSVALARTAQELVADCEKVDRPGSLMESGFCMGYIDGVTDAQIGFDMSQIWSGKGAVRFAYCLPSGVTLGQIRKVFLKFMHDNPANLHYPANAQLVLSLSKAFPCP